MKNFLIGLLIGIVLCSVACFLVFPTIKETAYNTGYDAGNKKGISTGTATGITQGIAEMQARQKHERDSLSIVEKNQAVIWKATHKPKKVVEQVQNWHVIDGKVADPVAN